jgi:YegS/Rv2252/BmrU family lipid kinase
MKIAFLVNSTIRKLTTVRKDIETTFKEHEIKFFLSERVGHIYELAQTAISRGFDHIIVVGGDGTLNEGINGIVDTFKTGLGNSPEAFDWEKIKQIKVGVYPAGSGNDFVRTVYKNTELSTLKKLVQQESSQMIDIGWVSFMKPDGQASSRFYMNITDVGMGGEAVLKKERLPKWLGGDFNYFWSITTTVATYENCNVRAYNETFEWKGKVINMIVANGRFFGSGLGIAPDASITDGKFSFVIIGDINLLDYFKHLGTVKKAIKVIDPKVEYHTFDKISIESTDARKISIDMDGEFIGYAPMTLICLQQKINFIM